MWPHFSSCWSDDGQLNINLEDEIIRETLVTHENKIVHPRICGTPEGISGSRKGSEGMSSYEVAIWVFMLAAFLGFELIRRVSPLLHTPLMSLTNAISAITVVGAILVTGEKDASHADSHTRLHRRCASHNQRSQRLSHHRPHAQNVQEARGRKERH